MGNLEKILEMIEGSGVRCRLERVPKNPVVPAETQGEPLTHYRCRLSKTDAHLDVYVSILPADEPLTMADVIFLLAMDACGCDTMGSIERYRARWDSIFGESDIQPKDIQFFWQEYAGRCEQSERLRGFLGGDVYAEMMRVFGEEEPADG